MLTVNVEGMHGSSPEACAEELIKLASLLKVCAAMDFNGIHLFACPNESVGEVMTRFKTFERAGRVTR